MCHNASMGFDSSPHPFSDDGDDGVLQVSCSILMSNLDNVGYIKYTGTNDTTVSQQSRFIAGAESYSTCTETVFPSDIPIAPSTQDEEATPCVYACGNST